MLKIGTNGISSDIVKSVEKSDRKVNKIPNLEYSKIKERIIENFIIGNIDNPSRV